jgi:transposase
MLFALRHKTKGSRMILGMRPGTAIGKMTVHRVFDHLAQLEVEHALPISPLLAVHEHHVLFDRLAANVQLIGRKVWVWVSDRQTAQNRKFRRDIQLRADDFGIPCDRDLDAAGENVEVAFVDQGYTGEEPAEQAAKRGIRLIVVKLEEAKKGFVLLPRRWVVERSFAWAARFRRLARDYERLPSSLAALHWLAFLILMLNSIFHQRS